MAKTAESVTLRLLFDTGEATKATEDVKKQLQETREAAQRVADNLQSTVHGRLLTGLAGAVKSTIGQIADRDLPEAIAKMELEIAGIGAATGALLGPQAGAFAEAAARKAAGSDLRAAQGAIGAVNQAQSVFADTALAPEDTAFILSRSLDQHRKIEEASRITRENIEKSLPSLNFKSEAVTAAAKTSMGAVGGLAKDLAINLPLGFLDMLTGKGEKK